MASLFYSKLAKYLKVEHLEKINIEDFLSQFIVNDVNNLLALGDVSAINAQIPQKGIEFEAYLEENSEKLVCSRLAFYSECGYVVLNYNGDKDITNVSVFRNDNFFEPSTDSAFITNDEAIIEHGNRIIKKEIEKGK